MKIKQFLLEIFGLLALLSCSDDELISVNRDGDEITFNVVTNAATRAKDVYCNRNSPNSFYVYAIYNGKTYIKDDFIQWDNDKWVNTSGTRYWPNTGEVTFFAHCNAGKQFDWDESEEKKGNPASIKDFTVESDVGKQVDLLYARKQSGKTSGGVVTLNFRHALSQIVFRAKNTNPNLYVEIDRVSVCKVKGTGTFTYPSGNSESNIECPKNEESTGKSSSTINYKDGSWGEWKITEQNLVEYIVNFDIVKLEGNKNAVVKALTSENDENKEFSSKALLLLPQKTEAWVVKGENVKANPAEQSNSYFLVKCRICNVVGNNKKDYVQLWGGENEETANIAIPVKFDWKQGKKYIYTFVFGDGNGGYNPNPDPDPKPDPILVPITFDVTVDEFVSEDEDNIEINMEEPKDGSTEEGGSDEGDT